MLGNGTIIEGGSHGASSGNGLVSVTSFSNIADVDTLAPAGAKAIPTLVLT